jgi:hypothetical protein
MRYMRWFLLVRVILSRLIYVVSTSLRSWGHWQKLLARVKMALLEIRYIPLSLATLWDKNSKLHDIGSLIQSIERYGFRDAPIFDETLDCIVAGNGRITALSMMKAAGKPSPDGIFEQDGEWMVPVQFGINASSPTEGEAFAIDHNNLTMMGGNLTPSDIAQAWDVTKYTKELEELAEQGALPVSVDGADLDVLIEDMETELGSRNNPTNNPQSGNLARFSFGKLSDMVTKQTYLDFKRRYEAQMLDLDGFLKELLK